MSDYIRREDAVNTVIPAMVDGADAEIVEGLIYMIKPADVVQMAHARWENYSPITIKCSRCGHVIHDWRYSECKYCPNCGAKMDGGDEHGG